MKNNNSSMKKLQLNSYSKCILLFALLLVNLTTQAQVSTTSLTLSSTELTTYVGQTFTISATTVPASASNSLIWSVNLPDYVQIQNNGDGSVNITALKEKGGMPPLIITASSSNQAKGLILFIEEASSIPTTSLTLSSTEITTYVGETVTIYANTIPASAANSLTWGVNLPDYVQIQNNGDGSVNITALNDKTGMPPLVLTANSSNQGAGLVIGIGEERNALGENSGSVIYTSGNVGIGNANPTKKLDVKGDINFTGNLYQNGSPVNWNSNWEGYLENIFRTTGKVGIGTTNPYARLHVRDHIGLHGDGLDGSAYQMAMFYANESLGLYFDAPLNANGEKLPIQFNWRGGGTPPLYINGDGDIGIGTKDPTHKLHVNGAAKFNVGSNSILGIYNWNLAGPGGMTINAHNNANTAHQPLAFTASVFYFSGGTVRVNGNIVAKEMRCRTEVWSDFVFKDDYKLKSLNEVESYINENNHLPDVPSEEDVLEEGINVGEMNAILLQKIEELTLYIIDQNKQLKDQQQQINNLTNRFNQ